MSIYRNVVWYMKGLQTYTKSGFEKASMRFQPTDLDVDVSSTSFMVTGANAGLGYSTALELAKRQGIVHLVCRNEEKGTKAKDQIIQETNNNNVHLHIVDLSKPKLIAEFTSSFSNSLDVLINNAGCMVNERTKTDDNLDTNFATNTLGHYVITRGLIPTLSKSKSPRVIFVSSGGMLVQKLDTTDLNFDKMTKYDGVMAYAQNKRQQVVMCEQFAKLYPKIFFASMHPGWAETPGVRSAMPDFFEKMKGKLRTPEQGADTIIWLAISRSVLQEPSGEFYQDRIRTEKHLPLAWTHTTEQENSNLMKKLQETSTSLGITFPN